MIRIKSRSGLIGATVETEDGVPIGGITELKISIQAGDITRAVVDIHPGSFDVLAHPLLSLESVKHAAAVYGYALVNPGDACGPNVGMLRLHVDTSEIDAAMEKATKLADLINDQRNR
jgi:sporulation protein YlmC with PRC-barrel domain